VASAVKGSHDAIRAASLEGAHGGRLAEPSRRCHGGASRGEDSVSARPRHHIAIVRSLGQRLIELAQQERIAAIQRGVDLSSSRPCPHHEAPRRGGCGDVTEQDRRRSGLLFGESSRWRPESAFSLFLRVINDGERALGVASSRGRGRGLLLSAFIVRQGAGPRDAREVGVGGAPMACRPGLA